MKHNDDHDSDEEEEVKIERDMSMCLWLSADHGDFVGQLNGDLELRKLLLQNACYSTFNLPHCSKDTLSELIQLFLAIRLGPIRILSIDLDDDETANAIRQAFKGLQMVGSLVLWMWNGQTSSGSFLR